MAATISKLSLQQFMLLPDRPGVDLELCDGKVAEVPPVGVPHNLQEQIRLLLKRVLEPRYLEPRYHVRAEFSYGFAGEGHRADVGAMSIGKWLQCAGTQESSPGATDLLVEILSPSNTTLELNRLGDLCFRHGCEIFAG